MNRRARIIPLAALAILALLVWHAHITRQAVHAQSSALQALANARPVPRNNHHHKLEPTDAILHGAGQSDEASFNTYTASLAPAKPMLMMRYVDLRDNLPAFFTALRSDLAKHDDFLIPQLGLSLNAGKAATHYEAATAEGDDDARIAQLCEGLRSLQRPSFLRIGYEFNGPWNGYEPQPYVAAFRKIATAVHACSATTAIVWDWSPDAELDRHSTAAAAATRWQSFYPGDTFIDWWALNLFRPETMTSPATQAFLREAGTRKFPIMIAESSLRGPDPIDHWFAPYFGLIRSTPAIKAFCYIDWDWRQYPQWKDWGDSRIESNPAILNFYTHQILSNPLIANARPRAATLKLLTP